MPRRPASTEACVVMHENAQTKARRYLTEGRLVVSIVHANRVRATCRGDGRIYELDVDHDVWSCSCEARGRCSHLLALGSVIAIKENTQ